MTDKNIAPQNPQNPIVSLLCNDSPVRLERMVYQPPLIPAFREGSGSIRSLDGFSLEVLKATREQLPFVSENRLVDIIPGGVRQEQSRRIGIVLSGGPAPGGHNVIAGVFEAAKRAHPDNAIIGFLAGPKGIITKKYKDIDAAIISEYKNSGGFHMLGTGRDKIDNTDKMAKCRQTCADLQLDGLVVVGGDDSNTNAAFLAEDMRDLGVQVIGVPKTIDGDLQVPGLLQVPFGYHSACMSFATEVGNLNSDCKSDLKYWHFNRLMGRSASHIALEVALQTHPNVILIGEEIEDKELTIHNVVRLIADVVVERARRGMNYGTILIPEGILEFIHEINVLIIKISYIIASYDKEAVGEESFHKLPFEDQVQLIDNHDIWRDYDSRVFLGLPTELQRGLLLPRDSHGNFQYAQVRTERILLDMVATYLRKQRGKGIYKGTFKHQNHYYGYDGRGTFPTKFDCDYGYNLGVTAFTLLANGCTGYMAAIKDVHKPLEQWRPIGIPLAPLMHLEERRGRLELVIAKQKVDLDSPAFKVLAQERIKWAQEDHYRFPGPIQFSGPCADAKPITLQLNALGL
ncbi:diphosphate--fructose-6-phosphate 1-phosphotransferase [Desulfobacca acetoxidans]